MPQFLLNNRVIITAENTEVSLWSFSLVFYPGRGFSKVGKFTYTCWIFHMQPLDLHVGKHKKTENIVRESGSEMNK